jgi:hypothetical protein
MGDAKVGHIIHRHSLLLTFIGGLFILLAVLIGLKSCTSKVVEPSDDHPGLRVMSAEIAVEPIGDNPVVNIKPVHFFKSYALIIGESAYTTMQQLPGVREDVEALKRLFEEQGFTVETIENADGENLNAGIVDFFSLYGYDEETRLIVYYAGAGHTMVLDNNRSMGYIIPIDAPSPDSDERGFLQCAIAMQQFDTWAKTIKSHHVLFMFDACFSGSVFNTFVAVPMPEVKDYHVLQPVRQFITAGMADEVVPDRSIFRRQLEVALRDGEGDLNHDGYVSGSELGYFLQSTVVNYSHGFQHPQYGKIRDAALDKGDFLFRVGAVANIPLYYY